MRRVVILGPGAAGKSTVSIHLSEITGLPIGTIKSHVHRGKEKIRQRFFPGERADE